jgi:hypothetical protein
VGPRLPLARLSPGFTNCESGHWEVKRNGQPLHDAAEVKEEEPGQYWLNSKTRDGYDEVHWSCYFSNGHALDAVDTALGLPRAPIKLEPNQDAVLYELPFGCDRLSLKLSLPHPVIEQPVVLAQHQDCAFWIDQEEAQRLQGALVCEDARRMALTVDLPVTGHRYGFRYRLGKSGARRSLPSKRHSSLENIITGCRSAVANNGNSLSERLTAGMADLCRRRLQIPAEEPLLFVGRVWSHRARRLLTAFGHFPPETWAASFAYGTGIAGHAFRFHKLSAWEQLEPDPREQEALREARLIYQRPSHELERATRRWIIEVPLFLDRSQTPIGTIGLAGPSSSVALESFASMMFHSTPDAQKTCRKSLSTFSQQASVVFWKTTAQMDSGARQLFNDYWRSVELKQMG